MKVSALFGLGEEISKNSASKKTGIRVNNMSVTRNKLLLSQVPGKGCFVCPTAGSRRLGFYLVDILVCYSLLMPKCFHRTDLSSGAFLQNSPSDITVGYLFQIFMMITVTITPVMSGMRDAEGGRERVWSDYIQSPKTNVVAGWFYFLFSLEHRNTITLTHNGNPKASLHPGKTE